jgi:purine-binding chemotaxis protein CheW
MATLAATQVSQFAQNSGQFSTFFVADMFFGVDVLQVQEVLRAQQMSPVPRAPDVIEGLINLRGQIVTAIDMRRRLELEPRSGDRAPMNIVVRTSDGAVSLLVDEIGDVLDMDASTFEQTPEGLDSAARELIRGVYKLKDRLLLVLDTEKAIEIGIGQVTRNERLDSSGSEGRSTRKRSASSVADAGPAETQESAQVRGFVKNEVRKTPPKKAGGTTRGAQGGAG